MHGLTSSIQEPIIQNGSKYFAKKWFTTYRFNFYGNETNARKLGKTTLKNHITDTNKVIKYFKEQWHNNIFLIGHSFGWLTILYTNTKNISWIILRDPSIGGKELLDDVTYDIKTRSYSIDRGDGYKYIIGSKMYKDFSIEPKEHLMQITRIHLPTKIICAEKWLQKAGKKYYKTVSNPKEFSIIPWASHCFNEEGTEEKLFEETYKRVKKYS
jgi:pimeloyl-ACP methyl ester carboxylesterase